MINELLAFSPGKNGTGREESTGQADSAGRAKSPGGRKVPGRQIVPGRSIKASFDKALKKENVKDTLAKGKKQN